MGVAREVDLDRRHRRYGETIASPRHQHLSKAILAARRSRRQR